MAALSLHQEQILNVLSLHQEQVLNQEGGPPVPENNLESLQERGMIPSFCKDENLSKKRVFLPHPLDCGLFCTSTSRDFFSSKKATDSTRRRKEGCRFYVAFGKRAWVKTPSFCLDKKLRESYPSSSLEGSGILTVCQQDRRASLSSNGCRKAGWLLLSR